MKPLIPFVFATFFACASVGGAVGQSLFPEADELDAQDMVEINLNDFLWKKRPIVVFADTPADPRFREQMEFLADRKAALDERDVVVLFDTDPEAQSSLRTKLRPKGFMLVLIGKDGGVKLRKPFPWSVRELSRTIDKMPLRREEIREKLRSGN